MKKKISILALSAICLLSFPVKSVSAAGAELPENFEQIQEQEDRMSEYDIYKLFSNYEGETISHTYTKIQIKGDKTNFDLYNNQN